jgi:hypothetical protein
LSDHHTALHTALCIFCFILELHML